MCFWWPHSWGRRWTTHAALNVVGYIVARRALRAVGKRVRHIGQDVSAAEALSDRYRLDIANLLFQLERDPLLDREQKLVVLYSNINNILPILLRLCTQAADEALGESDVGPSLVGAAKQMRAAVRDLMDLDRAVTMRQRRTRPLRRPH